MNNSDFAYTGTRPIIKLLDKAIVALMLAITTTLAVPLSGIAAPARSAASIGYPIQTPSPERVGHLRLRPGTAARSHAVTA